jgi:hypothetical protein
MTELSEAEKIRLNLLRRAARRQVLLLGRARRHAARDYGLDMYRPVGATDTLVPAGHGGYGYDYNTQDYSTGGIR